MFIARSSSSVGSIKWLFSGRLTLLPSPQLDVRFTQFLIVLYRNNEITFDTKKDKIVFLYILAHLKANLQTVR